MRFAIFITVALLIYGSVNTYIYLRVRQSFGSLGNWIWLYRALVLPTILAFPLSRILRSFLGAYLEKFLFFLGSWWLAIMFYLFMTILVFDLMKLILRLFRFIPTDFLKPGIFSKVSMIAIIIFTLLIVTYGYFRAADIGVKHISVDKNNRLASLNLRAVMFSDLHLGRIVNEKKLKKVVSLVNSQNPDLIFIVGDLVDENPSEFTNFADDLKRLKSKYGVFAVTGNHEYYHGLEDSLNFMKSAGIKVLRNEYKVIDARLVIAGIDDDTSNSFGIKEASLEEILSDADKNLPKIFLKHKPLKIKEAQDSGIDLMLSGHVHGGQFFPVRFITNKIFKLSSRDFTAGNMRVFVSDGAGTWGSPVRIGADPEIVVVDMGK